jgi:hypothetical protein
MADDEAQRLYTVVSQNVDIHPEILKMLVRDGLLAGDDATCDPDQARRISEQLHAARNQVSGQGIVATDVPEKYGFNDTNIYRWHKDGWIKVVGKGRYNARLFDEGDIAFLRALADMRSVPEGGEVVPSKPRSGRPRKESSR